MGQYVLSNYDDSPPKIERNPEKWMSIKERLEKRVKETLKEKDKYIELDELIEGIFTSRNRRFITNRQKSARAKEKVTKFYEETLPPGVSMSSYKITMNKKRREKIENEQRTKKIFMLHRWEYVLKEKQRITKVKDQIKFEKNFVKDWITLCHLLSIFRVIFKTFDLEKKERMKQWGMEFIAKKLTYKFNVYTQKRGETLFDRILNQARYSLNFRQIIEYKNTVEKAKNIVLHVIILTKEFRC